MLVTGWGRYHFLHHWDQSHVGYTYIDEEEINRSWVAAVQELNRFFAEKEGLVDPAEDGDVLARHYLTQDEIKYHVFHVQGQSDEKDFPLLGAGYYGVDGVNIKKAIRFALGVDATVYMNQSFANFVAQNNLRNVIVNSIDGGYPAIIKEGDQVMMVDAYAVTTRNVTWIRLLNPENHGSFQWRAFNSVDIDAYVDYDRNISVKYSDKLVRMDSDGDGLVDLDEKRFGTKVNKADSDGDGVSDKNEITTRVNHEIPDITLPNSNYPVALTVGGLIRGVAEEVWADVNKNGVRAELDPAEIGNGTAGLLNGGNRPLYVKNGVPGDFDIYAINALEVQEGVSCLNLTLAGAAEKCSYASESVNSSVAARVSQSGEVGSLFAKNRVVLGGDVYVRRLELLNDAGASATYSLTDNASVGIVATGNGYVWPWQVNLTWDSYTTGSNKIVNANESYTLTPTSNVNTLRVKSGGTLRIEPGVIKLNSLLLEEGSEVRFIRSSQKTTIHVRNRFEWNPLLRVANGNEYKNLAKNFKIVYEGASAGLTLASNWAGVMFAPQAFLNLGSSGKTIYGRFVGAVVTVKAGTTIKSYHGQEW